MAILCKVKGVPKCLRRLKARKKKEIDSVAMGLKAGGLFLQRESQKIVPVQLGNLKNSAGTRSEGSGKFTVVIIFYTAKYAVYVHENLDALHGQQFNAWYAEKIARMKGKKGGTARGGWFKRGPNQQAKFLETPAREKRKEIVLIVVKTARGIL
jgi:hypothetical protein